VCSLDTWVSPMISVPSIRVDQCTRTFSGVSLSVLASDPASVLTPTRALAHPQSALLKLPATLIVHAYGFLDLLSLASLHVTSRHPRFVPRVVACLHKAIMPLPCETLPFPGAVHLTWSLVMRYARSLRLLNVRYDYAGPRDFFGSALVDRNGQKRFKLTKKLHVSNVNRYPGGVSAVATGVECVTHALVDLILRNRSTLRCLWVHRAYHVPRIYMAYSECGLAQEFGVATDEPIPVESLMSGALCTVIARCRSISELYVSRKVLNRRIVRVALELGNFCILFYIHPRHRSIHPPHTHTHTHTHTQ